MRRGEVELEWERGEGECSTFAVFYLYLRCTAARRSADPPWSRAWLTCAENEWFIALDESLFKSSEHVWWLQGFFPPLHSSVWSLLNVEFCCCVINKTIFPAQRVYSVPVESCVPSVGEGEGRHGASHHQNGRCVTLNPPPHTQTHTQTSRFCLYVGRLDHLLAAEVSD